MLNLMAMGCVKVMQHLVGVHVEEDRSVSEHLSAFVLFCSVRVPLFLS